MYDMPMPSPDVVKKMRVLSIDVGMKNLAYCLFERENDVDTGPPDSMMQHLSIVAWDTVNLCEDDATASQKPDAAMCSSDGCKFPAKFAHSNKNGNNGNNDNDADASSTYYCTRHANSSGYKMPLLPSIASSRILKKMTLDDLKTFSGEYLSTVIPEKCNKSKIKLLQHVVSALDQEYLVAVSAKPKVISAASMDLITIGRNMHKRFDALSHISSGVDTVIIENQLSTLATRMKTLQGMITQYFIMRGVPNIQFISATNKLKLFSDAASDDKTEYADRKKRSIEITRTLIPAAQLLKFEKHKKKDDLADCFLQGLWWFCTREKL
jgi:hypothetical protein